MSPSVWMVVALAVGAPAKDAPKKDMPTIVGDGGLRRAGDAGAGGRDYDYVRRRRRSDDP